MTIVRNNDWHSRQFPDISCTGFTHLKLQFGVWKMTNVACRYMQDADRDAVCLLLQQNDLPADGVTSGQATFLVLEEKEQIIGCGALIPMGRFGVIRSIAVHKDRQTKGYGRLLLDRLQSIAALHNVDELFLLTVNASAFFKKMGFVHSGQLETPLEIQQSELWENPCCSGAESMKKTISRQAHYFPKETLQLQDDLPGVKLWAVSLQKTMMTYFTVEANSSFAEHSHESEQITMVLSGELFFSMEEGTHRVGAGEVIAIGANIPHAVYTRDKPATAVDAWSPVMDKYR
ncbi:MAG TPA: GNAT family N-acetyltransferase [Desulfocapsa sulfexigens]|nr:GNAT family N-acetyltransferase [Desulfocapsa sulfexigens]